MIRGLLLGTALALGAAGVRPTAAQLGEGNAPCLQGQTRGFARNAIWVDDGCRGEFEVVLADGRRRAE